MPQMSTTIARADAALPAPSGVPAGSELRPCRPADAAALGRLSFEAHGPDIACDTPEDAVADIRASFDGAYGAFWPAASPLIARGEEPVAAVLTVRRAPWVGTPDGPFVIELFTARPSRRRGLARLLVRRGLTVAADAGEPTPALRVDPEKTAARALYASARLHHLATRWQRSSPPPLIPPATSCSAPDGPRRRSADLRPHAVGRHGHPPIRHLRFIQHRGAGRPRSYTPATARR